MVFTIINVSWDQAWCARDRKQISFFPPNVHWSCCVYQHWLFALPFLVSNGPSLALLSHRQRKHRVLDFLDVTIVSAKQMTVKSRLHGASIGYLSSPGLDYSFLRGANSWWNCALSGFSKCGFVVLFESWGSTKLFPEKVIWICCLLKQNLRTWWQVKHIFWPDFPVIGGLKIVNFNGKMYMRN